MSGSRTFENILSIRVLEWLVILVGCKMKGISELEARESKILKWFCIFYKRDMFQPKHYIEKSIWVLYKPDAATFLLM